jgi:hypothetical protein
MSAPAVAASWASARVPEEGTQKGHRRDTEYTEETEETEETGVSRLS